MGGLLNGQNGHRHRGPRAERAPEPKPPHETPIREYVIHQLDTYNLSVGDTNITWLVGTTVRKGGPGIHCDQGPKKS